MKRLELIFENAAGKAVTYSVDNPQEPADPQTVSDAMDEIIAQNVLTSNEGPIVAKKGARIVERTVTDITFE